MGPLCTQVLIHVTRLSANPRHSVARDCSAHIDHNNYDNDDAEHSLSRTARSVLNLLAFRPLVGSLIVWFVNKYEFKLDTAVIERPPVR